MAAAGLHHEEEYVDYFHVGLSGTFRATVGYDRRRFASALLQAKSASTDGPLSPGMPRSLEGSHRRHRRTVAITSIPDHILVA